MSTLVHRLALLSFIGLFLTACNDSTICESDFADGQIPAGCLSDAERSGVDQKRTLFVNESEAEYDQKCAGCHGLNGEGGDSAPAFKAPAAYEFTGLVNKIETTMPKGNAEACDATCADAMARFILSGFQEVQADDVSLFLNQGQAEYSQMCVGCHGVEGEGGSSRSIDATSYDLAGLTQFVNDNMPLNNAERCQGDCASNVAAYILSGFRELIAEGELPNDVPPTEPAPPGDGEGGEQPVDDIVGNAENGGELYAQQCAVCHGSNGEGGGGGPALNQKTYEFAGLEGRINDTMPLGNAEGCVGECATDIARFIIDTFTPQEEPPAQEPPSDEPPGDEPPSDGGEGLLSNAGAADYAQVCAACHGANGEGGSFPALNDPSKYELETLIAKISDDMPPSNASACNGDCADQVAKFILSGFQEVP